jgi:hypothetical protein
VSAHVPVPLLERCFDLKKKLQHVDHIFKRVFGNHD